MRRSLSLVLFLCASAASAATFTVTNNAPSDSGSLRQAILAANATPGNDQIVFAIPGVGVHTIALASPLPTITEPVIIDGFSQPGSAANTQPVGQGLNAVLQIEIDGTGAAGGACFTVAAGNDDLLVMAIQGLAVNRCPVGAIDVVAGGSGALIAGNFLGSDPTGTSLPGPQGFGVRIVNALHVAIGGTFPFERNLISGNDDGVVTDTAAFLAVRGNLVGTNAAGTAPLSAGFIGNGLKLDIAAFAIVGGDEAGARNVISGVGDTAVIVSNADTTPAVVGNFIGTDVTGTHVIGGAVGIETDTASPLIRGNVVAGQGNAGVRLENSSSTILGNFIGTDLSATLELGNSGGGIYVLEDNGDITIGGTGPGEGNVIAHNGRRLISFIGGIHVRNNRTKIRGNRIFDNRYLGIDLLGGRAGGSVTVNDPGDLDGGPNAGQNFPIITNVVAGTGTTDVFGYLDSTPSTSFDIDFFAGPSCSIFPNGFQQGERYISSLILSTDAAGRVDFLTTVPYQLQPGESMTATATDPQGRTSEFSQRLILSIDPRSGPNAGGTAVTIEGMEFSANTLVAASGLPLTNIQIIDYGALTGVMPALSAGLHDVVVQNPPNGGYSLVGGWLSDFLDVPAGHVFYDYVVRLATNAISAGVGGGNFGVTASTTRQQMAVFLLKAEHGSCYVPPPCAGLFPDVPCSSPFAPWIERLAAEGVTSGCGNGNFCPQNPVRRDQMAVFLLKAAFPSFVPNPCAGTFDDVPCSSPFAPWIEALASGGITGGCGGNNYCPLNPVTRGQMAALVWKTFYSL
jgi:hypothetical protein